MPSNTSVINPDTTVNESQWKSLKQFTSARIAIGRAGNSIPTQELLGFQLDHARAIDAVHKALDVEVLKKQLMESEATRFATSDAPIVVNSKARDRMVYLQRPDLGRQLEEMSWENLKAHSLNHDKKYDLAIVIGDGLSSTAIQNHALPVVERLAQKMVSDNNHDWSLAPITIATQARVAIGDDIGECLNAKIVLILIGERPGLTSPDSMGIYMTWSPKRGAKESSRNCISNIRPEGLGYDDASNKAFYLLGESLKLQISGIELKDRSSVSDDKAVPAIESASTANFMIAQDILK
ncbi:ethanolamine ammonia-lyase subunit EutC [Vibrio hannami]|uniref:ethanolamine ammonia-lyase subunit EutC n=1 Tax=Vibrio hannami TaxID=2717094 RepID=UPI00240F6976|nr:ethanolamine ammonia-lyase subunit EutC [Vibrio hannami]MDG3087886.1 ethanolamine ammonia-lyase subunit EutC [Vibrio hannami]